MDQVYFSNLALSTSIIMKLSNIVIDDILVLDSDINFELTVFGSYLVFFYVISLYGIEYFILIIASIC